MHNGIKYNTLLSALNIKPLERIICIKEHGLADANFILTNIMKQAFTDESGKVCLVIFHNTIGHYQNIAKRLGYDLLLEVQKGNATIIEPLKILVDNINSNQESECNLLSDNKELIVKSLFLHINSKVEKLAKDIKTKKLHLIIDDVNHLLDLGVSNKFVIIFTNYCVNLLSKDCATVVMNFHVSNNNDEMIANAFAYVADVNIKVATLKTGISHEVSGVISIYRGQKSNEVDVFHYKASDREIKVFAPGESLYSLYK